MPKGLIHTKRDEHLWSKAKSIALKQYYKVIEGSDKFYAIVMGIYKKMKGGILGKSRVKFFIKGRKLHYRTEFQDLPVSIENRKGSIRRGKDRKGEWETKMTAPYGYLRRTIGADSDQIDCFLGKEKDSRFAYVIHIKDPKTGKYDEDKVFLGYKTFKDAMKVFKQNYDDWKKYYQGCDIIEMEKFKKKIEKVKGRKLTKSLKGAMKPEHKYIRREGASGSYKYIYREKGKSDINTFKTNNFKSVDDFKNRGEFIDYCKSQLKKVPHPHVSGSFTYRPFIVGYGCDGSTDANIHYVAQKMCRILGLDYAKIYDKAYKNNVSFKDEKAGDWLRADWENWKDEALKNKKVKDTTIIPKNATIQNVLEDLYDINNRSLVAELENIFYEKKISTNKKLSDLRFKKSIRYIVKSWSSAIQSKYPGGKWITVSDKSSPMAGRHLFIVQHKDGTATIAWAPGHSGLTHKVLQPKKEGKSEKEKVKSEEKEKPEMAEEERLSAEERKKELVSKQKQIRYTMHEKIREKLGVETEVTKEEKEKIEEKISEISDKKEKTIERLKQFNKIKTERDKAVDEIIQEAKKSILGEEIAPDVNISEEKKQIREIIKENAEEFLKYHYQVQAYQREKNAISKILRQKGKFKGGSDIVEIKPMNISEIKDVVTNEKALEQEIGDHYQLIINTRGGIGKNGEEIKGSGTGSETIRWSITKGGFEAITGLSGEFSGNSIIDLDTYRILGSNNASVLMNYYVENTAGGEYEKKITNLRNYIEKSGQKIAKDSIDKGDKYLKNTQRIRSFGRGEDALFGDRVQANATALQYIQRAYECYGQSEGALNLVAELLYQFESKKRNIELESKSRQTLNNKRKQLRLNKSDVIIKKLDGNYKLTIRQSKFEKLIKEKPIITKGISSDISISDIKAGRANTFDYLPMGLKPYLPPDKNGVSQKLVLAPHQQSAARLIDMRKRMYLNFEAGTGKSLTYLSAISQITETTGKQPKTVISMPQKLMPNFKDEVEKFSDYKVRIITKDDSKKTREKIYSGDPKVITLINKEKFNFDRDLIKNAGYEMVMIDEAHRSTQREGRKTSAMSQGIAEVAEKAEYFVAGTGTPTVNNLSELYFYLKVMDPEKYSNQKLFMEKYSSLHRGAGLKEKLQDILNKEIDDRVFTVKKDLRHTFNQHLHNAELSDTQKKQYKRTMQDFGNRKIDSLARDRKLNRILNVTKYENNPKFNKMGSIIDNHLKEKGSDEKVLIYAYQYDTVDEIKRYLKEKYPKFGIVEFNGHINNLDEINENKRIFKTDKNIKFAIHTEAGTEGLNLQYTGKKDEYGATTAIAMASGANSYSTIDQFFSRADRIGVPKEMNIDGHLVLTDTPHDIKTEMRLEDKKAIMNLIDNAKRIDDQDVLTEGGKIEKSIKFVFYE